MIREETGMSFIELKDSGLGFQVCQRTASAA